jgi:uncharacterized protein YbbC (DUF1343 family)/CubicO group peptidase (beta-lactamase class C family)
MRIACASFLLFTACAGLDGRGVAESRGPGVPPPRDSASSRPVDPLDGEVDATIAAAIQSHRIPGGVIHIEHDGAVYEKAYGNRAVEPAVEAMTTDTVFDMASITKVAATTPSVWLLIQRGKLALDDKASRYLPEFHGGWRDEITIRHLLTHTSGLRPDLDLDKPWSGYDTAMKLAFVEEPRNRPGTVFKYSDINFELLGEIVHRVSGVPLDVFASREIYKPLGMKSTGFRPVEGSRSREADHDATAATSRPRDLATLAPTEYDETHTMLRGVVHDPTARRMGGVAGHAGLFSNAHDMALYARMLLRGGAPVFTPEIVKMMTTVQSPAEVAVRRTGGFDYDSGYSRPRGDVFPIGSFGHTGFTGTILWIDPASRSFYVFLSNRVHPDGKGNVAALQRALGTLAGRIAGYTQPVPKRVEWIIGGADAANGIDVLASHQYDALRGRRIGLITNNTGIDRSGNPTADLLRGAPGVELKAYFSPEHGFRGTVDADVDDSKDSVTGLPVYSLYGKTRKPLPQQFEGIDTLVFDIQDVGARFYTYISTMDLAMEAAAAANVRFVVLDRVNPIGGEAFEGPLLKGETDFIAAHPIPVRHGMTVGELAGMIRDERHLDLDLQVVKVARWKREQYQDEAGLPWINTSPNMRSLTAATLYPGVALVEYANISVGRGTATPFEHVGAPWIDGAKLAAAMPVLPGVRFEPTSFTPVSDKFPGVACSGIRFIITDRKVLKPVLMGVALIKALHDLWPAELDLAKVDRLLRDPATIEAIRAGRTLSEIEGGWGGDTAGFAARRAKYLLY